MSIGGGSGSNPGQGTQRASISAALDLGSNKICCLIAEIARPRRSDPMAATTTEIRVLGAGYHRASGMRNGAIVDLAEAERAIRAAVHAAEAAAGVRLERVFVNLAGGNPRNDRTSAEISLNGNPVSGGDLEQLFHLARLEAGAPNRMVIHAAPIDYHLDGQRRIADPRGMYGDRLAITVNAVSVAPGPMRNLALAVERCHLDIEGLVISPYASGLATLVEDEREIGATCIDIGAGTTSLALFAGGHLAHAEVLSLGSQHITNDIARGLSTPIAHAERMKTLYGSAIPAIADERELISVPLVGESGTDTINKIPRSMLTGIIQPRLEEIFEMARDRVAASGLAAVAGRRIVITGGGSLITGARELAASVFDRQVRIGVPMDVRGLPEDVAAHSLSVAAGLLKYAASPEARTALKPGPRAVHADDSGYLARVGSWLRESF